MRRDDLDVAGVRTAVAQAGAEHAEEAVVCVHGNPGSWRDWQWVLRGAAGFARVVAPDMPGFGASERARGFPYTVPGYADHLTGVLGRLGVRRAHLVLHDFGGPWGLEWAARNPDAVASVTLVNTGLLRHYRWHTLARVWRTPVLGELFQAATTRRGVGMLLDRQNPRPLPKRFVDRMYADIDRGTKRAVLALYRATSEADLEAMTGRWAEVLRPRDLPALVVWGDGDPYLPHRLAEAQREAFPSAEIHRLPGLGHWPWVDDEAAVAGPVLGFLERVATSPWQTTTAPPPRT